MKKTQSNPRSATASIRGAILRSRNVAGGRRTANESKGTAQLGGGGLISGGETKPRG